MEPEAARNNQGALCSTSFAAALDVEPRRERRGGGAQRVAAATADGGEEDSGGHFDREDARGHLAGKEEQSALD